jgi:hypothetical protein
LVKDALSDRLPKFERLGGLLSRPPDDSFRSNSTAHHVCGEDRKLRANSRPNLRKQRAFPHFDLKSDNHRGKSAGKNNQKNIGTFGRLEAI